jgi:hypothetical protein
VRKAQSAWGTISSKREVSLVAHSEEVGHGISE